MTPGFAFAEPAWLLGLLLPVAVWFWLRSSAPAPRQTEIARYADAHLLPHLSGQTRAEGPAHQRWFVFWALAWTLGVVALAGPRWDFREERLYRPANDLVVVLDISRSMLVDDVKPSRQQRARQEIEDLINLRPEVRLGLIAFASTAHVIAPLTEDYAGILHTLPSITPELVSLPGSRLTVALRQAEFLIAADPDSRGRSILVVSDGDIADSNLFATVGALRQKGITVHALGIGTPAGGSVPGAEGQPLLDARREPIRSALNEAVLRAIAREGGGLYVVANYQDDDMRKLLAAVASAGAGAGIQQDEGRVLIWNERYGLPLALSLMLLLPWFRKVQRRGAR